MPGYIEACSLRTCRVYPINQPQFNTLYMRLMLIHADSEQLIRWRRLAAARGHVIEYTDDGEADLVVAQTIYEPDAILMDERVNPWERSYQDREIVMPEIIRVAGCDEAFERELQKLESTFHRKVEPIPQDSEGRIIFWSPDWPRADEKLHLPDLKANDWKRRAELQGALFSLFLQDAAGRFDFAERWLTAFESQLPNLRRESAYRFCHGSWKAYAWTQEAKFRLCAFFCELLPIAEREFLPPPTPPRMEARFVHYHIPTHLLYPFMCLAHFSLRAELKSCIAQSLTEHPHLFSAEVLAAQSAKEMGLLELLHQVAKAHLVAIKALLDRTIPLESVARELGTVFEFWDMEFFNRMTFDDIRKIANATIAGDITVENPPQPMSYRELVESFDKGRGRSKS